MCSIMFGKKEYLDLNIACKYNIYGPSCWYANHAPGTTVRVDLNTPRRQTSSQESQKIVSFSASLHRRHSKSHQFPLLVFKRRRIVVLGGPFLLQSPFPPTRKRGDNPQGQLRPVQRPWRICARRETPDGCGIVSNPSRKLWCTLECRFSHVFLLVS